MVLHPKRGTKELLGSIHHLSRKARVCANKPPNGMPFFLPLEHFIYTNEVEQVEAHKVVVWLPMIWAVGELR
jgi:hypothetical protein